MGFLSSVAHFVKDWSRRAGVALREKRHRLAPFVVAAAVLVLGSRISKAVPRDVDLRFDLGPDHAAVDELRIAYEIEGDEVEVVKFAYPEGAPSAVDHRVTLAPGTYDVVAHLRGFSVVRTLTIPAEGRVRIRLDD